jgi:hypothetical protein
MDESEAKWLQPAIDGGGAHRQELAADQRLQAQRALCFQCGDELIEEWCQALATHPATCFGADSQRTDNNGRIDASAAAVSSPRWRRAIPQQTDGVLAVIARGCAELVE